jgi:magnesium transporter
VTHEACHGRGAFAWIGLYEPTNGVKKISARTTVLVVPTIITGIYGMYFEYIPGLAWRSGYPFAPTLMVVLSVLLCGGFKRYGWL